MTIQAARRLVVRSPAKLNLGLEVVRRRNDGYHDIVTVMQAITLTDHFLFDHHDGPFCYRGTHGVSPADDLVQRVLDSAPDREIWRGALSVEKRIPLAAGLGGGSSNAATALRIAFPDEPVSWLLDRAADLGSDVPFFIQGGRALASGRGTELSALPDGSEWYVIIVPDLMLERKTANLFGGLEFDDFSSGSAVMDFSDAICDGGAQPPVPPNAFERHMRRHPIVEEAWQELARASGQRPNLSGAGPAMYVRFFQEQPARRTFERIDPKYRRFLSRGRERDADVNDANRLARALRERATSV